MSDMSQGPGWWQASDGKWYPPESAQPQAPGGVVPPAGATYGAVPGAPAIPATGGAPLAVWGQRVVATLIDAAFMFVVWLVVFIVSAVFGAISESLGALVLILGYIVAIGIYGYFLYMTGVTGQSPGKRVHGIKVISENTGQPLGGPAGILRYFAHIPDGICMIGYLFPLWDPKKQTFADKIQTSVVIADQPKQSLGPDLFKI